MAMIVAAAMSCTLTTTMVHAQHGLSVDIGPNHPEDSTRVTYLSLGVSNNTDTLKGLQLNAISNIADQNNGIQLSGFNNIAISPLKGLQLTGISNISMGVEKGLQLAGVLNVSSGNMKGLQIGSYNYAESLNGTQVGLFNVAGSHPKGWQIGFINYTKDSYGNKIGLVNVSPKTSIDVMAFVGTSSKLNAALRFRNRSTYNIIGIGSHYMGFDEDFSGSLFYRIGQYFQLSPKWTLSGDIGFSHIETFKKHSDETPDRLFALEARLNADYKISRTIGAFASVGLGDTRYYHHVSHYRTRLLAEAGLTFNYPHDRRAPGEIKVRKESERLADSLMAPGLGKKHPWWAFFEVTAINTGVQLIDRYIGKSDFAQTTLNSIWHNFETGFVWDNDVFSTNMWMHPYHGNLYFNAARSQGLTFWESVPYAFIGTFEWELFGETEPPAINDILATSFGGICIGEITNRISRMFLNDSKRGWPRFWAELGATVTNPIGELKRIATGDAWRVRSDHYLYHDYNRFPVEVTISFGDRYLADNGALFRGGHNPYVDFYLEYGDAVNEEDTNKPYDFFDAEFTFNLSTKQPIVNQLHLMGRLWSTPMIDNKHVKAEVGLYQHFDYFDSKPVKDGSDLTPYRMSEVAALGPGAVILMPEVGMLTKLEQRFFLNAILLGGTKSDYYNVIERDYNMGSGFSIKSKTEMQLRNFGRFVLNAQYYHIFTWKGYDQEDLNNPDLDLHYLNSQGDKGNARLLVINPLLEFNFAKDWSILLSGTYYGRRTHYSYYDDVRAHTFELRLGACVHL